MYAKVIIFLVFSFICSTQAAETCPDVNAVPNFDLKKYVGKWYETYRYETSFQIGGDCVSTKYELIDDGISVRNSMVRNGTRSIIDGKAQLNTEANGSGKLFVAFPMPNGGVRNGTYWVLSTDYTSYSLVYSCNVIADKKREFSWVLSRTKTLKPQSVLAMDSSFKSAGLNWDKYRETSQSDSACRVTKFFPKRVLAGAEPKAIETPKSN